MSDQDTIRQALYDAIEWQQSLISTLPRGEPERAVAIERVTEYRRLLRKHFGDDRTPGERLLEGAAPVSIFEIAAKGRGPKS